MSSNRRSAIRLSNKRRASALAGLRRIENPGPLRGLYLGETSPYRTKPPPKGLFRHASRTTDLRPARESSLWRSTRATSRLCPAPLEIGGRIAYRSVETSGVNRVSPPHDGVTVPQVRMTKPFREKSCNSRAGRCYLPNALSGRRRVGRHSGALRQIFFGSRRIGAVAAVD
jgi:hypothetical protein